MMRRLVVALFAMMMVMLGPVRPAMAHDGHDHKVMGTITMVAADHIMVKATDGKEHTIKVTKDTKTVKGKETIKLEDVKPGTRVVVTAATEKEQMMAKTIQVGTAPEAK